LLAIFNSDKSHYPKFPIPDSWQWVKLEEIGLWQSGATPSKSNKEYYGAGVPWLNTGDLNDGIVTTIPKTITQKALQETSVKIYPKGSVLIAMYGATIGKLGILNIDATTNQACCACYNCFINRNYLFYFLLAWRNEFIEMGGGGAQPNISKEKIESTLIPLPPIAEQNRIVAEIDVLLKHIGDIEYNKQSVDSAIQSAKSKILELAMQGKLVAHDPSDEPAADMLRRVNPKARIIPDNPHCWNIPNGWCICQYKSLINSPSTKPYQILQSEIKQVGSIPVISQSSNFIEGYCEEYDKVYPVSKPVVIFGDHTRNVKYYEHPFVIGADGVKLIAWDYNSRFLYYTTLFVSQVIPNKGYSRHFQYLTNYIIGVPPLNEQKRIVAKIEELYSMLDKISASLQS